MSAPAFTLYGRKWCHLCDDMLAALEAWRPARDFSVTVVDVDSDPALEAKYDEIVPVLALGDREFRNSILNNVLWLAVVPAACTFLGLVIAVLTDRIWWGTIAKSLIFLPLAISFVGASVIWKFIYEYKGAGQTQIGILNAIVQYFGGTPHPHFTGNDQGGDVLVRNVPVRRVRLADGEAHVATVFDLLCANYGLDRGLGGDCAKVSPTSSVWRSSLAGCCAKGACSIRVIRPLASIQKATLSVMPSWGSAPGNRAISSVSRIAAGSSPVSRARTASDTIPA